MDIFVFDHETSKEKLYNLYINLIYIPYQSPNILFFMTGKKKEKKNQTSASQLL